MRLSAGSAFADEPLLALFGAVQFAPDVVPADPAGAAAHSDQVGTNMARLILSTARKKLSMLK